MATTRRASSRRVSKRRGWADSPDRRTPVSKKKSAKGQTKPAKRVYTAPELRKAFPNATTEDRIPLKDTDLHGNLSDVVKRLKGLAKSANIKGDFEIGKRSVTMGRGRYDRYSTVKLFLIGKRPYTDAELVAAGPKLVSAEKARIEREHKAAVKRVNDYNRLAAELGQPVMELPVKPEMPNLPV